jgi:hypothetical protein
VLQEQLWILVVRSVPRVGLNDQLRARDVPIFVRLALGRGRLRARGGVVASNCAAHNRQREMHLTASVDATSPRARARITGLVYLLYFLTAVCADVVVGPGRVVLFDAVSLIAYAFYVAVTLRFYYMFRPVNRSLSLLAAFFSLVGCANDVLSLFNLALYKISGLAFFGPYCLLIGYLIFRSTFLPRILGVLMALAGVGWLIFLSPLASQLSTYLKILGFLAEASLMLWLVVKGVNISQWKEQASAS